MSVRQAKLCDYNHGRPDGPPLLCDNLAVDVCMVCDKDTCADHTNTFVQLMFATQAKSPGAAIASHIEIASTIKTTGILCLTCSRYIGTVTNAVNVVLREALTELQTKVRAKLAAGALD